MYYMPILDILDKEVSFTAFRHDNPLISVFPLKGRMLRYVSLSGEKDWMLVQLNQSFLLEKTSINYVLVKRGDKRPLILNKDNQLVIFKPVHDVTLVREDMNDTTDFPMEFWALCK